MPHEEIRKRSLSRTAWISLLCAALLLVAGIGSVFAYVIIDGSEDFSKQIVETFTPGSVDVEVTHTKDEGNGIHTFTVTNTGNVDAYVRLALVFNWTDENGNVHWETPDMSFDDAVNETGWTKVDGYFYYPLPVAANEAIVSTITVKNPDVAAPEGFNFTVTAIAEGIQAVGETDTAVPAIDDAWGKDKVTFSIDPGTKRLTVTKKENP